MLNQHNHPSRKNPAGLTPGWELVALKRKGLPCHPERGAALCCLAPPRPDRNKESRPGAGVLAVRKMCGVAPPFHWAGISQGVWRL